MLNKTKKFVKENKEDIIVYGALCALPVLGVVGYTAFCNSRGYYMAKPVKMDKDFLYAKTPFGRHLRSPILKK